MKRLALGMVCGCLAAGAVPAEAGWHDPQPYLLPLLNVSLISVNGVTAAQASGGLMGGLRVKYADPPHWLSHTRGVAQGIYGLNTGSLGGDFRVGSFIGPDGRWFLYQLGPDVWYNGYGSPTSVDYFLPWAPGFDLKNQLVFKLLPELQVVGEATPGWVFDADRRGGGVGPFHELTLAAMVVIRAKPIRLTVGYTRQYRAFGTFDGIILSGAL